MCFSVWVGPTLRDSPLDGFGNISRAFQTCQETEAKLRLRVAELERQLAAMHKEIRLERERRLQHEGEAENARAVIAELRGRSHRLRGLMR